MKEYDFKIDGMHCTSCAMNIEGKMEEIDGIKSVDCNFAKGILKIVAHENFNIDIAIKMIDNEYTVKEINNEKR